MEPFKRVLIFVLKMLIQKNVKWEVLTKQGFKCTCLLKLKFGIKIRYHVRYKSSQGSRIRCESKKNNKEKNAKQYYRYNDITYVQLSSNYEKAIQNAN